MTFESRIQRVFTHLLSLEELLTGQIQSQYIDNCNYYTGKPTCPTPEYGDSPVSYTCYRIVNIRETWEDAKQYCEDSGEYLATFQDVEQLAWFDNFRKSNPGMKN